MKDQKVETIKSRQIVIQESVAELQMKHPTVNVIDLGGNNIEVRVKSSSSANSVGYCISESIHDHKKVKVAAIGARAVNQAVKAMAIAGKYVRGRGLDLLFRPGFDSVETKFLREGDKNNNNGKKEKEKDTNSVRMVFYCIIN